MSFLVAFNGQFSPHQLKVERVAGQVPTITAIRPAPGVQEFKNILNEFEETTASMPHSKMDAYQQHSKTFQQQKKREHAKDIMTSPIKMIRGSAPASEAKNILEKFGFRHLPVVNDFNVIIGMISDRELLGPVDKKLCHEIMIQKIIVSDELTSINEIAITLLNEKINALPIINRQHEVTGIITLTDILDYVIKSTAFLGSG